MKWSGMMDKNCLLPVADFSSTYEEFLNFISNVKTPTLDACLS